MKKSEIAARSAMEAWLRRASNDAKAVFTNAGYQVGQIEIYLGLPWHVRNSCSAICTVSRIKGVDYEIFFSDGLRGTRKALETLLHEMAHAAVGTEAGHGPAFRHCLKAIGFKVGKTVGGEKLTPLLAARLDTLIASLGEPPVPFDWPEGKRLGWQGYLERFQLRCPKCLSVWIINGTPCDADSRCAACRRTSSNPSYLCTEQLGGESRLEDVLANINPGIAEEAAALLPLPITYPAPYSPQGENPVQSVIGVWIYVLTIEHPVVGAESRRIVGTFPSERTAKAVALEMCRRGARFQIQPRASLACQLTSAINILVDLQAKDSFHGMPADPQVLSHLALIHRKAEFLRNEAEDNWKEAHRPATSGSATPTFEDLIRVFNNAFGPWPSESEKWRPEHPTLVLECRSPSYLEIIESASQGKPFLESRAAEGLQVWIEGTRVAGCNPAAGILKALSSMVLVFAKNKHERSSGQLMM